VSRRAGQIYGSSNRCALSGAIVIPVNYAELHASCQMLPGGVDRYE
jgi:hypothetical protein